MEDALAGTRVLVAGGEGEAARALGARLASGAAQFTVALDAEAAAQAALAGRPDVIVALGAAEAELRELLDPLDLRTGPPLVPAADLDRHPPRGAAARRRQDRDPRLDPAQAGAALGAGVRRREDARRGGARVLADAESEVLEAAESIARSHHERWDGSGYPGSLAGADIPLVGRLVPVAGGVHTLVPARPPEEGRRAQ